MALRDYQKKAVDKVVSLAGRGRNSACLVMPPGGGKTYTGSHAAIEVARQRGGGVLWVAHRKELVMQAAKTLESILGYKVGIIAPWASRNWNRSVQVGSIQTIRNIQHDLPRFAVGVWDEAHHAVSDDWNALAMQLKAMRAFLIGLTATPERADGRSMKPTFTNLILAATTRQLISKGFLVPTDVLVPPDVLADGVADLPVTLWEKHARGTKTVVFCSSVEHAVETANEFHSRGYRAAYVEGNMSTADRTRTIDRFVRGTIDILTNCQILTEGFDLPPIETIILARTVGSASLYLQMVGRGSRPHADKSRSLCLDLTGATYLFGQPDDEREFSLDGKPIRLVQNEKAERRRQRCHYCGTIFISAKPNNVRCPRCSLQVTGRKLKNYRRPLGFITSDQQKAYEQAKYDMWMDYAKIHGKSEAWAREKFAAKFGRDPK